MDATGENLTDAEQQQITAALATLRIIAGALIMGVASFAAITIIIAGGAPNGNGTILFWIAIAVAVAGIIASQIATAIMSRAGAKQDLSVERSIALYTTRMIVGLAILEGAAFVNLVFFIITGRWLLFAAVALLVIFMFAKFPTRGGLVRWIEERKQLAALEGNEYEPEA